MKKFFIYLLVLFVLGVTTILWFLSKAEFSPLTQWMRYTSQLEGLYGLILMSLTLFLSTRAKFLEDIFDGLDKALHFHKFFGVLAFVFLINHPLLLALESLPAISASLNFLLPSGDLSYSFGVFSLYLMILAFVFMVFIKLPYHHWLSTHKLLGLAFLLASLHAFLVPSDVSLFAPLKVWIGVFATLGVCSAIYSLILRKNLAESFTYYVEKIERSLDIFNIYLRPSENNHMSFTPGQFVYVQFNNPQLGKEIHPFSVSSAPNDQHLRLSVKIVGDYTLKLPTLQKDTVSKIFGPYGRLGHQQYEKAGKVLWVAGGIGATPFLSMLRQEAHQPTQKEISFFYCVPCLEEGVFKAEIESLCEQMPHVKPVFWCSEQKKRLTAQKISEEVDIKSLDMIILCGPPPMIESLKDQLIEMGVGEDKIYYENFHLL